MDSITIPVREPLTFERLKELNPTATTDELIEGFGHLPDELREQAWTALRLQAALDRYGEEPFPTTPG